MTMKKFNDHKSAQASIAYYNDGSMALISYTTTVIMVDKDGWLHVNGLYSRTTIKHIGWFMKMIGSHYYVAKQLLNDCKDMNIYTGEVRDWE